MTVIEDPILNGNGEPVVAACEEAMAPKSQADVETGAKTETGPETDQHGIDFVTLGMFIIDRVSAPNTASKRHLGGAGTYSDSVRGYLSPPPRSGSVGWIVDKGSDFPLDLEASIASWGTSVLMRETPERLTTRGWNGYDEHQNRAFKYMTPKKRLTAEDLTPELLASRTFHLICSPQRCRQLVLEIKDKRADLPASISSALEKVHGGDENEQSTKENGGDDTGNHLPKPIFIWEPP
ncbi:hypothetical protein NUW58_g9371 [Xylaria curta]|uniref:Uncharacterized protein n=1 Tax=Xylaria curta TaxID=42375 RepID=A0ACC1MXV8_9PEZI|nr:hypothetical protein NUW58_g9371 [Xylaria curta]